MNERRAIEAINGHPLYQVAVGSRPCEITPEQQRAAQIVGRLLLHAHKRRKRRKGRWV